LAVLAITLLGCSASPGAAPSVGAAASSAPAASAEEPAPSVDAGASPAPSAEASSAPSSAAGGAALPASCAEGFAAYLRQIEPIVSSFDPADATLGDLSTTKQAVQEKSVELLMANDATAPYSCSEVGLEWAYFDSNTPWDAVLVVAGDAAPGTVGYLTAVRDMAAIDVSKVTDYGVEGCDAAVASIKERVAAELSGGASGAEEMGIANGLALLGLYKAYLRDVQTGACPRDALGNDEFDFFGRMG
jgi:hypothetical protein